MTSSVHDDVEEILLDAGQLERRIIELGAEVAADYAGMSPVLISVLKGSIVFLADLVRRIDLPLSIDIMEVSSYGAATESTGQVRILKDLSQPIEGRHVLVVEDIIDTGLTLNYLLRYLRDKSPASLKICTLLDKYERREVDVPLDYVGFHIPNEFVFGYGLDLDELYRNLPFIGVVRD